MLKVLCLGMIFATPSHALVLTIQNGADKTLTSISVFPEKDGVVIDDNMGGIYDPISPGDQANIDLALVPCQTVRFYYQYADGAEANAGADLCKATSFRLTP